jgi:hypothetical protein
MATYVDPIRRTLKNKIWPFETACHMIADSLQELHAMADAIGLKRSWFQANAALPHYDLTANKRYQAVRHGAVEISFQEVADKAKAKRRSANE